MTPEEIDHYARLVYGPLQWMTDEDRDAVLSLAKRMLWQQRVRDNQIKKDRL